MRNRYPGRCYRCAKWVEAEAGHFERLFGTWRVQHASCAIEHRGEHDPVRAKLVMKRDIERAQGTGKQAQRARRKMRKVMADRQTSVE